MPVLSSSKENSAQTDSGHCVLLFFAMDNSIEYNSFLRLVLSRLMQLFVPHVLEPLIVTVFIYHFRGGALEQNEEHQRFKYMPVPRMPTIFPRRTHPIFVSVGVLFAYPIIVFGVLIT